MSVMETSARAVEDVLAYLAKYMIGRDLANYCELATHIGLTDDDLRRHPELEDPYILVNSDFSLLTVFEVQGCFQIITADEFATLIDNLRVRQNGYLRRPGHSLVFSFERDPERALDELVRLAEPQLVAARRIGLRTEDIILDRIARNAPLVAWEQNLLVAYTHTSIMSKDERQDALKRHAQAAAEHRLPPIRYGQTPASVLLALKDRHDMMLERVQHDFEHCGPQGRPGVMLRRLDVSAAVRAVRVMVNRERTSQKFRPALLGQPITPHGRPDAHDASDLVAPLLSYQICGNDVTTARELVQTDDLSHGVLSMELGPADLMPFRDLLSSLERTIPWRIRYDLAPCGLEAMRGRQLLMAFAGILPANRDIRQALLDLEAQAKTDAVLSMKVALSTWAPTPVECRRRLAALEKALQAWGACQVTAVHGDPIAAWASSIPGFTTRNVANRLTPPLPDALSMLPLQRPATPFGEGGNLLTRTPDGKIYPIQIGSRLQDTWIELYAGTPGSGKSGMLNATAMAALHTAGATRLPFYTTVEVGASAIGQIELIRDALPESRKSEALYLELDNSSRYMVNLFDTQLGARFPTRQERDFQVDFLNLLCCDPDTRTVPADCARANEMLVNLAYEDRCSAKPHLYEPEVCPEVDKALAAQGLRASHDAAWWECATWWEVTDILFSAGCHRMAAIAQRHAVPVLPDFNAYLHHEKIRHLFGSALINGNGEPVLAYMDRCFAVANNSYVLFQGRTQFELDAATRITAINLNNVIGSKTPQGELRTAIMYMFGRFMAAKNYFLRKDTLLPVLPPIYHDYHLARIAEVKEELKSIVYDETHNAGGYKPFVDTMIKDGREGRKWGIRIVSATHYLADHPPELRAAATNVYIMRGGNAQDEAILREEFTLSDEAIQRLQREAVGPGPEGVNFLALIKTKLGLVVQMLTNTVGPIEQWAFSTTLQDVALRDLLAQRVGIYAARRILARHFPAGTATATLEKLRTAAREHDSTSVLQRLADQLLLDHMTHSPEKRSP